MAGFPVDVRIMVLCLFHDRTSLQAIKQRWTSVQPEAMDYAR